jgi:hypothetical protein
MRSASRSTTARSWLMNSDAKLALQLTDELEYASLYRHVECARRLVTDEQLGLECKCTGATGALSFAV